MSIGEGHAGWCWKESKWVSRARSWAGFFVLVLIVVHFFGLGNKSTFEGALTTTSPVRIDPCQKGFCVNPTILLMNVTPPLLFSSDQWRIPDHRALNLHHIMTWTSIYSNHLRRPHPPFSSYVYLFITTKTSPSRSHSTFLPLNSNSKTIPSFLPSHRALEFRVITDPTSPSSILRRSLPDSQTSSLCASLIYMYSFSGADKML